jgi:hypothetical protein
MRVLRPILDQLSYWRSLKLTPFLWPVPSYVVSVALVAWLGLWALVLIIPILVATGYVLRFDRLLRFWTLDS